MDIYDIGLYAGYFLVLIGAVAAILLPLVSSLGDPKSLIKTGVAVVGILIIFVVAYSLADNEVAPRYASEPFNLTPGVSQFVGGLLISSYFLFVIAFVGIFVTEITKVIK